MTRQKYMGSILAASLVVPLARPASSDDTKAGPREGRVPAHRIPAAPALSPQAAIEPFQIDPAFRVELAAAEPMVDTPVELGPNLDVLRPAQWVELLAHSNGWVRDTAQRQLVEKGAVTQRDALVGLVHKHSDHRARLHAIWVLEGLDLLDAKVVVAGLRDPHPKVRMAAVRHTECLLDGSVSEPDRTSIHELLGQLTQDPSTEVRMQLALALSAGSGRPELKALLEAMDGPGQPERVREIVSLGLGRRQPEAVASIEPPAAARRPLSEKHQALFEQGRQVFEFTCIACHQAHGLGQEGLAPPLVGSEWVAGSPERLARIVLHGLRGPIKVRGGTFELDMPPLGVLDDDQIAGVLTYVRREWGHAFDPIEPELIKKVRAATEDKEDSWTEAELLKIP